MKNFDLFTFLIALFVIMMMLVSIVQASGVQ